MNKVHIFRAPLMVFVLIMMTSAIALIGCGGNGTTANKAPSLTESDAEYFYASYTNTNEPSPYSCFIATVLVNDRDFSVPAGGAQLSKGDAAAVVSFGPSSSLNSTIGQYTGVTCLGAVLFYSDSSYTKPIGSCTIEYSSKFGSGGSSQRSAKISSFGTSAKYAKSWTSYVSLSKKSGGTVEWGLDPSKVISMDGMSSSKDYDGLQEALSSLNKSSANSNNEVRVQTM